MLQATEDWDTFEVPLDSTNWLMFNSDGDHLNGPSRLTFEGISLLVLEFGGEGIDRPGPGSGSVLIRRIFLKA
jgi:hypothetical protein